MESRLVGEPLGGDIGGDLGCSHKPFLCGDVGGDIVLDEYFSDDDPDPLDSGEFVSWNVIICCRDAGRAC
jgi:hypothetical protein